MSEKSEKLEKLEKLEKSEELAPKSGSNFFLIRENPLRPHPRGLAKLVN